VDWQLGGFAVDPPSSATGTTDSSSQAAQLVQMMAGFAAEAGAADGKGDLTLAADMSQQPFLTTPHA
jgi:hypothetical protein